MNWLDEVENESERERECISDKDWLENRFCMNVYIGVGYFYFFLKKLSVWYFKFFLKLDSVEI